MATAWARPSPSPGETREARVKSGRVRPFLTTAHRETPIRPAKSEYVVMSWARPARVTPRMFTRATVVRKTKIQTNPGIAGKALCSTLARM